MSIEYASEYAKKITFADEAVKLVLPGCSIRYAVGDCVVSELDVALARRKDELRKIKIYCDRFDHSYSVQEVDPDGKHFRFIENASTVSGSVDRLAKTGAEEDVPLADGGAQVIPCFIFMATVSPMNKDGYFWFARNDHVEKYLTEIDMARYVILEINENIPDSGYGKAGPIHISRVDYVVPSRNSALIKPDGTKKQVEKETGRRFTSKAV